jgi:hypothetical protein
MSPAQPVKLASDKPRDRLYARFAPARSLYASAGFSVCGAFGDYDESENKTFMTLTLWPHSDGQPSTAATANGRPETWLDAANGPVERRLDRFARTSAYRRPTQADETLESRASIGHRAPVSPL